jgi:hypothetical protein
MRYIAYILLSTLLFWSMHLHAEGNCPPGQYPQQGQGWQGCVPIPGDDRGQGQSQALPAIWLSRWQAIAIDGDKAILGTSVDRGTQEDAENLALADCVSKGGTKCQLNFSYGNGCVAMIVGDHSMGVKGGATPDEARDAAMLRCQGHDTSCHVYYSACSYPIKTQ